eukprot:GHVS01005677.1.p1 GENE.GHVS01005677.1~~GHVS01005677.1.p1  ORF type:complete len:305 (+),score=35.59 GHVS01005677.1:109-1023(+)
MPPSIQLQDLFTYAIWVCCYYLIYRMVIWLLEPLRLWQATANTVLSDYIESSSRKSEDGGRPLADNLTSQDAPSVDLSVVIPAYNEEDRLPTALTDIIRFLESRKSSCSYEIIIVSDGCTDSTVEVAHRVRAKLGVSDLVRVISLTNNRGKGFSVRMGMHCAVGSRLLMVDADGASDIKDLPLLESLLKPSKSAKGCEEPSSSGEEACCDIVFGSRRHLVKSPATTERSWHRNLLMHCFHLLVKVIVGSNIQDTQCGFKLFSREAARAVFPSMHLQKWSFDLEIVVLARMYISVHISVHIYVHR